MQGTKGKIVLLGFTCLLVVAFMNISLLAFAETTQKTIKWKFAFLPPQNAWGVIHATEPHLDQIENATGGKLKIDRYYAQSLVKAGDTLEAARRGVIQIANIMAGFYPGQFPLNEVSSLPLLGMESSKKSSAISWMLLEKYPEIQKEFTDKNLKVLDFWNCGPYVTMTTKAFGPIKTMENFKGCKMRTMSGPPHELMLNLGASPLFVPIADLYTSLEKGVVDGALMPWEAAIGGWKLGEVTSYFTDVSAHYGLEALAVNLDAWNKLDKETQKAIMSVCGLKGSEFHGGQYYDTAFEPAKKFIRETPEKELIEVSADELARWRKKGAEPVWEKWVKTMESKGHSNARQILNDTIEFSKKYH